MTKTVDSCPKPRPSYTAEFRRTYKYGAVGGFRDSWRKKLYDMEFETVRKEKHARLSEIEIRELVETIFTDYGFPAHYAPHVEVRRSKTTRSSYHHLTHEIRLAAGWGQELCVVLHETTHALLAAANVPCAAHGTEFLLLVAELYEMYSDTTYTAEQLIRKGIANGMPNRVRKGFDTRKLATTIFN